MTIVVVNFKTADITCDCLDTIGRYVRPGTYEVIVVDNASDDGSVGIIRRRHPNVKVLELKKNLGFGDGNNRGVEIASAPYVVLLNSDAMLKMDTPTQMVEFLAENPRVMCVGPRIDLPSGSRQPKVFGPSPSPLRAIMQSLGLSRFSGVWSGFAGIDGEHVVDRINFVGWISGVCMTMRTREYQAVGGFDASFFMYCEDIDLCMRLSQLNGQIVHIDDWPVMHLGGASSRPIEKRIRNAVLQQNNLLQIIRKKYGTAWARATRIGMIPGQVLRVLIGLARLGKDENYIVRSSWSRLRSLIKLQP